MAPTLREDIEHAINRHSAENGSDTPDYILAEFLTDCLKSFDKAVQSRERHAGRPIPPAHTRGLSNGVPVPPTMPPGLRRG